MKTKLTCFGLVSTLTTLLFALGCSDQSSNSSGSSSAAAEAATQDDTLAAEILSSPDIMEAQDWLKRNPNSLFSQYAIAEEAEGGTPLGPVVERLFSAGAERVVIQHANGAWLLGVVVVLPADAAARQRVFELEPALSELCQQRQAEDHGQKHLLYTMD